MSTWDEAFNEPLLASAWTPLETSPGCLVKYAPHPHRPGYVLLLTGLSGVYVESLLASGIPSRLNEIKRTFKRRDHREEEEEEEDVIAQSEAALGRLRDFFGTFDDLKEAEVELRDHDYHDKVLSIHADGWDWLFNLTELKGREPVQILSTQLLVPLAEALADSSGVGLPKGTKKKPPLAHDTLAAVLGDTDLRQKLYPNTTGISSKGSKKAAKTRERTPERTENDEEDAAEEEAGEEEYQSSPGPVPLAKAKGTAKPRGERQSSVDAESPAPSASVQSSAQDQAGSSKADSPSASPPPVTRSSRPPRKIVDDASEEDAGSSAPPTRSASPQKSSKSSKKKDPDLEEANLLPPTQSSQKTKRQREEEEEEELDRKLNEMKKRMGSGGGGRLGKRRMAR